MYDIHNTCSLDAYIYFFFAIVGPITHSTDKLISRDNLSEQPGVSQDIQN